MGDRIVVIGGGKSAFDCAAGAVSKRRHSPFRSVVYHVIASAVSFLLD